MLRTLLILLALVAPISAQIVVPTDAPTLAAAVQMAQSGDRIFVRTLVPQAPVVIDKSLTIVGEPRLRIEIPCGQHAGVLLAGPGVGRVTLTHTDIVLNSECAFPDAGIAGNGFRELFLDDCTVDTRWTAFSGVTYGAPAIAVDVALITLHQSEISAGAVDADVCIGALPGGGHAGILAPNADLVSLHSTITGGDGGLLCCQWCSCPTDPTTWGGHGGVGAQVAHAYLVESDIAGGSGSVIDSFPGFEQDGSGMSCGAQPNGNPLDVISGMSIAANLAGTGALTIGERWTLEWNSSGDFGWVFGATRHTNPWSMGGPGPGSSGTVFIDPTSLFLQVLVTIDHGVGDLEIAVPPVLDLVGTSVAFQVLDSQLGLTSPVFRVVQI